MATAPLRQIAQFLAGMTRAEEISRDVSRRQAAMAADPAMRRFLVLQSRQEASHARVFGAALRLTTRRSRCPGRLAGALSAFEARLYADLDAGRLESSLIGLQGVLEAIGAVALSAPMTELSAIGARFVPFRATLLRQEAMHHRYGRYWLARLAAGNGCAGDALHRSWREYADLGDAALSASVEIFEGFDIDQRTYLDAGRAAIRAELLVTAATPARAPAGASSGRPAMA